MSNSNDYEPGIVLKAMDETSKAMFELFALCIISCGLIFVCGGMVSFIFYPWLERTAKESLSKKFPPFLKNGLNPNPTAGEELMRILKGIEPRKIGFDDAREMLTADGIELMELETATQFLKGEKVEFYRFHTYEQLRKAGFTTEQQFEFSNRMIGAERTVQLYYNYNENGRIETGKPLNHNPIYEKEFDKRKMSIVRDLLIWFIVAWGMLIVGQMKMHGVFN